MIRDKHPVIAQMDELLYILLDLHSGINGTLFCMAMHIKFHILMSF